MLTVTEKAAEYLREALNRKDEDAPAALRIAFTPEDGYKFALDDPKEGDQVFEREGQNYLVVEEGLTEALENAVLDVTELPQGTRITLTGSEPPAGSEAEEEGEPPGDDSDEKPNEAPDATADEADE